MTILKGNTKIGVLKYIKEQSAIIRTAELQDIVIMLSKDGTDIASETAGGMVEFNVKEAGTYTLKALYGTVTKWTKSVTVELNTTTYVKADDLDNYTFAEIHSACQLGIAHLMWEVGDMITPTDWTGSIMNNQALMIAYFKRVGDKDQIGFISADRTGTTTYDINPFHSYVKTNADTAWTKENRSYGGMKYCAMETRMKVLGDSVYTQATGILPDGYAGTLTNGVKFSDLVYSDTGLQCGIYSYNSEQDTMTLLNTISYDVPSNTHIMMIKGYFKSVGKLTQEVFDAGHYYTYNSSNYSYTLATTYNSSTTYYGLYENMQEDGVFYAALSPIKNYLVKQTFKASAGGTQTTKLSEFEDYVNLMSVEEITGFNRTTVLISGLTGISAGVNNLPNEGNKFDCFNSFYRQGTGRTYFTRSARSSGSGDSDFCYISNNGGIGYNGVAYSNAARVTFLFG